MARKTALRAVPASGATASGHQSTARKKHTVATAATDGDYLDLLVAMRDRIAIAVSDEKCPPRDLAALTKRLDDVVEKIAVIVDSAAADARADEVEYEYDDEFDAEAL